MKKIVIMYIFLNKHTKAGVSIITRKGIEIKSQIIVTVKTNSGKEHYQEKQKLYRIDYRVKKGYIVNK